MPVIVETKVGDQGGETFILSYFLNSLKFVYPSIEFL